MVSFNFCIAFLAVTLAGNVAATHIKRDHFLSHRNQCRPRLASTIQSISPSSIFPSALSSVPIPAQTSHSSTSVHTTTTAVVQPTSMTKVAATLTTSLTPNGVKAGIAGGDAYPYMKDHIGWWYDWSVNIPFFSMHKVIQQKI